MKASEKRNLSIRCSCLQESSRTAGSSSQVFHFYSQPLSWVTLYKIYEIIRDNIREKKIIQILTKNELSRFTGTAQSRGQIGDDARHAAKKFIGHPQPMTIEEANELIKKLINRVNFSELVVF